MGYKGADKGEIDLYMADLSTFFSKNDLLAVVVLILCDVLEMSD